MQEFDRGLRQQNFTLTVPAGSTISLAELRDKLQAEGRRQYEEAKVRIIKRLVTINIIILIGGGILSYFLALRTLKPIEEAHEAQSRFTADASHELRTPIAIMQSEIEVALMNPKLTLTQAKVQLNSNLEELSKLTALSEGLLRLARIENSGLKMAEFSLQKIIQKSIIRVSPIAKNKKIIITNKNYSKIKVRCDEDSLLEALVIIMDNAVKYSPKKSEVVISTNIGAKHTEIKIIDQGMGMKQSELPFIFERFYRADTARSKQKTQGYGLGLAIAKNIVDMHKGNIAVSSISGEGSIFTISLPI